KMKLQDDLCLYDVEINNKPTVNIEETEINFLNAKTWIPGKVNWLPISFSLTRQHDMKLIETLMEYKMPMIKLFLYELDNITPLEEWVLHNCRLNKLNPFPSSDLKCGDPNDKFSVDISYNSIEYKCLVKKGEVKQHGK